MPKLIAWSFSRLDTFEQCKFRFYHSNVTKQFKTDWNAPHILNGRRVHKMMEDAVLKGTGLSPTYAMFLPLVNALRRASALTEHQYCIDFRGRSVSWFDTKTAYFRQTHDIICSDVVPNAMICIDWKTGKVREKPDQLKLAAISIMREYPNIETVHTAYVWLDHPQVKPSIEGYNRSEYEEIWNGFEERADAIQRANQAGNWPKTKNFACPWCPALPSQCEYASLETR